LENLPASTRSFRRVGAWRLFLTCSRRPTEAGTVSTSLRPLARRGLANAVRPSADRKMTVFLWRALLKRRPLIVSVAPTLMRIGWTRVICGPAFFFLGAADATAGSTRRAAATSVRQMMMKRRMPSPYRLLESVSEV
jgi:hypothetical protein